MLLATFSITSCDKESDTLNTDVIASAEQAKSETGTISDHGLVNSGTRLMKTSFSVQNYIPAGNYGEELKVVEQFEISFYVDEDGFIPSGLYLYDNSDSKTAFTFDSAILTGEMTSPDEIAGGTISVSHDNGNYSIKLNCMLSSGEPKSINFNGFMSYADVIVK